MTILTNDQKTSEKNPTLFHDEKKPSENYGKTIPYHKEHCSMVKDKKLSP